MKFRRFPKKCGNLKDHFSCCKQTDNFLKTRFGIIRNYWIIFKILTRCLVWCKAARSNPAKKAKIFPRFLCYCAKQKKKHTEPYWHWWQEDTGNLTASKMILLTAWVSQSDQLFQIEFYMSVQWSELFQPSPLPHRWNEIFIRRCSNERLHLLRCPMRLTLPRLRQKGTWNYKY